MEQESPDIIGEYIWQFWKEGRIDTLDKHPRLTLLWQNYRKQYATTNDNETESFQKFFDSLVANYA